MPAYFELAQKTEPHRTATKIIPVPKPPTVSAAMTVPRLFAVPPTICSQPKSWFHEDYMIHDNT
jgi:hypothetical protein